MPDLPTVMVAPNGARKTKADHPAVPITICDLIETANSCWEAGARALHAHVRDSEQKHVLDAGMYRELLSELSLALPDLYVQITTEAVGRYSAEVQRQLVYDVCPTAASFAVREMVSDGDLEASKRLYFWALDTEIDIQHILYAPEDVSLFAELQSQGVIPQSKSQLMLVLGRYSETLQSSPSDLDPFLEHLKSYDIDADWAVCAFGNAETVCLEKALIAGGKARVGFENSLWNRDGSMAKDNAERVREICSLPCFTS